jgi:CRISPR/Cas system-associated exonuclease Cas4 (RecB family)
MKREKQLKKAFGVNEFGVINIPKKISNVQISRLMHCKKECSYCFPHGWEMSNSTMNNRQRNWKNHRNTRWKD